MFYGYRNIFLWAVSLCSLFCINPASGIDDLSIEEPAEAPRMTIEQILDHLGPVPRPEHPRPDRLRSSWLNLNGIWEFTFDSEDKKLAQGWSDWQKLEGQIVVPFCPESVLSGVYDKRLHKVCWYARNFDIPESLLGKRLLLHFGAVDYRAKVWLNGEYLGEHEGGYDPFQFEISNIAKPINNRLVVRVHDDMTESKCRGKQDPNRMPSGCVYMRATGIWQTVWLESVGNTYVSDWRLTTNDPESGRVEIQAEFNGPTEGLTLCGKLTFQGDSVCQNEIKLDGSSTRLILHAAKPRLWSPEHPSLYDLELHLKNANGEVNDQVQSYMGFRKIEIKNGMYYLNNNEMFWLTALDQGYYPDGIYTAPTDEDLRKDVDWAKQYGLNGIRKHQIVGDPRYLYWCDRLGLTVWGEMADWGRDMKNTDGFLREWLRCMKRDINHPCIITWVPTNEWKGETPDAIQDKIRIYKETKALDPARPAIDTSGYYHTQTDIIDLHENPSPRNEQGFNAWWDRWQTFMPKTGSMILHNNRKMFCDGFRYSGQPIVFSEIGNWAIAECPPLSSWKIYGSGPIPTKEEYIELYRSLFIAIISQPPCAGFSYVQLYDVEGEVNGYLTYDRKIKIAPEIIRQIHADGLELRLKKHHN